MAPDICFIPDRLEKNKLFSSGRMYQAAFWNSDANPSATCSWCESLVVFSYLFKPCARASHGTESRRRANSNMRTTHIPATGAKMLPKKRPTCAQFQAPGHCVAKNSSNSSPDEYKMSVLSETCSSCCLSQIRRANTVRCCSLASFLPWTACCCSCLSEYYSRLLSLQVTSCCKPVTF